MPEKKNHKMLGKGPQRAPERYVTYTVQKDQTWRLGYAVHISKVCPLVEAKLHISVLGVSIFERFAICKVCRHYELGDWQNFPKVAIQPHILARLEEKFAVKEAEANEEEEGHVGDQ